MAIIQEERTIKWYCEQYQQGNISVINELIGTRIERETSESGTIHNIYRLKVNDKLLNKYYYDCRKKYYWLDDKDIDGWFMWAIYERVLPKANVSMSAGQIASWAIKTINGYIENKKNEERSDDDHTIPESYENTVKQGKDDEELDENLSLYDLIIYEEFRSIEDSSAYHEFLEFFGGIENILSKRQLKLYQLMQDQNKTQEELAIEYGSSQSNISQMIDTISKNLKAKWFHYNAIKTIMKSGLYEKIKRFIEEFDNVLEFDNGDTYDYFGRVVKFLKENYEKGETELQINHRVNTLSLRITVFDLLTDEITKKTYQNLYDILEEDFNIDEYNTYNFGKREKTTIVNQVMKVFRKYIDECERAISKFGKDIADIGNLESSNFRKVV